MIDALIPFTITFFVVFIGTLFSRHSNEYKQNAGLALIVAVVSTIFYLVTRYSK